MADLQPHQQRVVDEFRDLAIKIIKLNAFIASSPLFRDLDDVDQALLYQQCDAMEQYESALAQRINRF